MAYFTTEESDGHAKDAVERAIKEVFTDITVGDKTLRLDGVQVDQRLDPQDYESQRQTKLKSGVWGMSVSGLFSLLDQNGKVKDTGRVKLMTLPQKTARHTFIFGGQEYQFDTQFRLKPGIYTRVTDAGEFASRISAEGKYYRNTEIFFDPQTKVYTLGVGTSHVPLATLLDLMGVSVQELELAVGKEVATANLGKAKPGDYSKLYKALFDLDPGPKPDYQVIVQALHDSKLDPDATEYTTGMRLSSVDKTAILTTMKKLFKLVRGETEEDDPNSLVTKSVHYYEDYLREWILKHGSEVRRKISNKLPHANKVEDTISTSILMPAIGKLFTATPLAQRREQHNVVDILSGTGKTTLRGPGGISDPNMIRDDMRTIHSSHMGFLDPIKTPEGSTIGTTLFLSSLARKRGNELVATFMDVKTGKEVDLTPKQVFDTVVAFPDEYDFEVKPPKAKSSKVMASHRGDVRDYPPSEVQYVPASQAGLFHHTTNLIPFLRSNNGVRAMTASRQIEQAISLTHREAPLVQLKYGRSDSTAEQGFGRYLGASLSLVDGEVSSVRQGKIIVKDKAGASSVVNTYRDFPLNNSKGYINSEALVSVGDKVKKGQVLADTNYTKNGTLALGTNLRVAYVPWKGLLFEDALAISESAATKLTSDHLHQFVVELGEKSISGRDKFRNYFPNNISHAQSQKLDSDGVITVGQEVSRGDYLYAGMFEKEVDPDSEAILRVGTRAFQSFGDSSIQWEKDYPGVVTAVEKFAKKYIVHVKTKEPAVEGDKLVGRHGNKGIISKIVPDAEMPHDLEGKPFEILMNPACYDDKTEVLTENGWLPFSQVSQGDVVASMHPNGELVYESVLAVHRSFYVGPMYRIKNKKLDLMVTPNHRMYTRKGDSNEKSPYEINEAKKIFGQRRYYLKNSEKWVGSSAEVVRFGEPEDRDGTGPKADPRKLEIAPSEFAEFLGVFIAEGWACRREGGIYDVGLSQSQRLNPDKCVEIERFLALLPWSFSRRERDNGQVEWTARNRELCLWLMEHVGTGAKNKRIPRQALAWPSATLELLLNGLMLGDGSTRNSPQTSHYDNRRYFTASKGLADDVQELALKLGVSAQITTQISCFRETVTDIFVVSFLKRSTPSVNWPGKKHAQVEKWVHYEGDVFCLTVPSGLLYVRRNGVPVWSGNSVVGRVNLGQVYETLVGKVAAKTGNPVVVDNFASEQDNHKYVADMLKKHGLQDREIVVDPVDGPTENPVLTGNQYIFKLTHQVDKKLSARGAVSKTTGERLQYTGDKIPSKGGSEGGQSIGILDTYALLANGATANLKEMFSYKGDAQNALFWSTLKNGGVLPAAEVPFTATKFLALLEAMGVHVKKDGNSLQLLPMTDRDIETMSAGELKNPGQALDAKLRPYQGGIFDSQRTGGLHGKKYTHMNLPFPVVNPVTRDGAVRLLAYHHPDHGGTLVDKILEGHLGLNKKGDIVPVVEATVVGGAAVQNLLARIDVDKSLKTVEQDLETAAPSNVNTINKTRKYLKALKELGYTADQAYCLTKFPVLPPLFRPIVVNKNGTISNEDINELYRKLGETIEAVNQGDKKLPPEMMAQRSAAIQDMVDAVAISGYSAHNRTMKGVMQLISGTSPKYGFYQKKVLKRRQDLSARSTIVPNPELDVDTIEVPDKALWELFGPFVTRSLVQSGYPVAKAAEHVKDKTEVAKTALLNELKDRPVLMKRDPVLHKFGIQAFHAKSSSGNTIRIPPSVTTGYGADFDGDQILDTVVVFATDSVLCQHILEQGAEDMTARLKTVLPTMDIHGMVFLLDLQDFPHGELIGAKQGEKGPIEFYAVPNGVYVLALDETVGALVWSPVTVWSKHLDREIEIITLASGRQIVSDDDPRAVYGMAAGTLLYGRFQPATAVESRVLVPRGQRLSIPEILHNAFTGAENSNRPRSHQVFPEVVLTEKLGYFLGAAAGDGWVSSIDQICLASIDDDVVLRFAEGLAEMMQTGLVPFSLAHVTTSYGESRRASFSASSAGKVLAGWIGKGAENKHLPPFFLTSPLEFRRGLFAGLMDTDGSISVSTAKSKPQLMSNFTSISLRLVREVLLLAASLGVRGRITAFKSSSTGKPSWIVSFSNYDVKRWGGAGMACSHKLELLRSIEIGITPSLVRHDLVPISVSLAQHIYKSIPMERSAPQARKNAYFNFNKAAKEGYVTRDAAERVTSYVSINQIVAHPDGALWWNIVQQTDVTWDMVESVEVTGIRETGYDLTVPGHETFMNVEGVVLSNTVSVYVPATEAAKEEAKGLVPSRNLFGVKSGSLMHKPQHEQQLGLYLLTEEGRNTNQVFQSFDKLMEAYGRRQVRLQDVVTFGGRKTTLGRLLVANAIPMGRLHDDWYQKIAYDRKFRLDKHQVNSLMVQVGKTQPADFPQFLTTMRQLGDKAAFTLGASVSMADLKPMKDLAKHLPNATDSVRRIEQYSTARDKVEHEAKRRLSAQDNGLYKTVVSGARGTFDQLKQIVLSPGMISTEAGRVAPKPINRSYAEGLKLGDYWTTLHGARLGMISKSRGTALPGYLSRQIISTVADARVTTEDCQTSQGIYEDVKSRDIIGRYLAKAQKIGNKSVAKDTLVDGTVVMSARNAGVSKLLVRTPLKCEAHDGICAKCFGRWHDGNDPSVGTNIGVISGQSLGEPTTQLSMKLFHEGGVASKASKLVDQFAVAETLLKAPLRLKDEAVLSQVTGTVTSINKTATGWKVFVGTKEQFVPASRTLEVKVGTKVQQGDKISSGQVNVHQLASLAGIGAAQNHMVGSLHELYGPLGVDKRHIETVVRHMTDLGVVDQADGASGFGRGDVVSMAKIEAFNRRYMAPDWAIGKKLAEKYLKYGRGTEVTDLVAKDLKDHNINRVKIEDGGAVKANPMIRGVNTMPLIRTDDWAAKMSFERLRGTMETGVLTAAKADIAGRWPLPSIGFGKIQDPKTAG